MSPLKGFLRRLVSHGRVYDLVQKAAGSGAVAHVLSSLTPPPRAGVVVDLGGGTGLYRSLWPESVRYVCVDLDETKLDRFSTRHPTDRAIRATMLMLPLISESVDIAVMVNVSHHLSDGELRTALAEAGRVLQPRGILIFSDAIRQPGLRTARLLWALDRGTHARSPEQLRSAVSAHFDICGEATLRVMHEYCFFAATKKGA